MNDTCQIKTDTDFLGASFHLAQKDRILDLSMILLVVQQQLATSSSHERQT